MRRRRQLGLVTDPCADPVNEDTSYCRERKPGESVSDYNARRVAEIEAEAAAEGALMVRVTRGVRAAAATVPPWVWAAAAVLAAATWFELRGRRRR